GIPGVFVSFVNAAISTAEVSFRFLRSVILDHIRNHNADLMIPLIACPSVRNRGYNIEGDARICSPTCAPERSIASGIFPLVHCKMCNRGAESAMVTLR